MTLISNETLLQFKLLKYKCTSTICESRNQLGDLTKGPDNVSLVIKVFHRGQYRPSLRRKGRYGPPSRSKGLNGPPSRSKWTKGSNCFTRGPVPEILRKPLATCDFTGGWSRVQAPCPPPPPPWICPCVHLPMTISAIFGGRGAKTTPSSYMHDGQLSEFSIFKLVFPGKHDSKVNVAEIVLSHGGAVDKSYELQLFKINVTFVMFDHFIHLFSALQSVTSHLSLTVYSPHNYIGTN